MRALIIFLAAAALAGCASNKNGNANPPPKVPESAWFMQSGGHNVLRLAVPADAVCTPGDGSVEVNSREDGYVEVWLVKDATTVDQAAAHAGQVIESEFKNLKVTSTSDLSVAGSAAKRLTGSGNEADDGDPGTADIVVFKAGGRVYVACTHGETMRRSAQRMMMDMVQSATAP